MLRMTSAQVAPGSQKGQQAETELQERSETLPLPPTHTHHSQAQIFCRKVGALQASKFIPYRQDPAR